METINTVCPRDCYDTCFMKVVLDPNNQPVRIMGDKAHPLTQGFLCPRGYKDLERANHSDRILYPYQRVGAKPDGTFTRISWDQALDLLVENLSHTLNNFGPEAILHLEYAGNQGLFSWFLPQRLFYAMGCTKTDYTLCSESGHAALALHYGLTYGVDPDELPDKLLTVFWGFNAAISAPHLYKQALTTKKNGGRIVVVDPRRSESVKSADIWIRPKPGSDVALTYGIMKHLIENNLVNYEFLAEFTHGFDILQQEIRKWNVDVIEDYTGVKWEQIIELAELYASHKPSVTMMGLGLQKSLYGAESVRAISLIPALVGLHRGFYYTNRTWDIDFSYLVGESLTSKRIHTVSQVALGKHLENGDFKCIYIFNMNPAETVPNHNAVKKGFARNDVFVAVHDTHWTESAKSADLVLPALTFLEKEDIQISYSHRYVRKSQQVITPIGESKSEFWITTQLTNKLNRPEPWLYEDPTDIMAKSLKNAFENGDYSDLEDGKTLLLKLSPKSEYQTPTGKLELFATQTGSGISPLPIQHSVPNNGEFIFLNTAVRKYTHTQFQDVYGPMPPIVHIHPIDVEKCSIRENDIVILQNTLGRIKLKAKISQTVPEGVLWAPHEARDLDGIPQNSIISGTTQLIGGGPIFNTTYVTLIKNPRSTH